MNKENILEIKNLSVKFPITKGIFKRKSGELYAVENVSLEIKKGETSGLVGESGCGKSTIGKAILNLLKFNSPDVEINGEIWFDTGEEEIDILKLSNRELRKYRGKIQIVFQDPYSSLNQRMSIGQIIEEPLKYHSNMNKKEREERVAYLLEKVGMQAEQAKRYPYEFSGGQRQRAGIARALATNPKLIIADEPVSALDVSIQAQVINLLQELQSEFKLSILFIAHDLSVVEHISSVISVMYLGRIIEFGKSEEVYHNPIHPYSKALLSAVPIPKLKAGKKERIILKGDVPTPLNKPSGCGFRTRCPVAFNKCEEIEPELEMKKENHFVACLKFINNKKMNDYLQILEDLPIIINHYVKVTDSLKGEKFFEDDNYLIYVEGFALKIFGNFMSIYSLYNGIDYQLSDNKIEEFVDWGSINALNRVLLESYLIFHYIFLDSKNDEEKKFRFNLWDFGGYVERQAYMTESEESDLKKINEKKELTELKKKILNNSLFNTLNSNQKTRILNEKPMFGKHLFGLSITEIAHIVGFDMNYIGTIYSHLCSFIHTSRASVMQLMQSNTNIRKEFAYSQLTFSIIILSSFLFDFSNLFNKAKIVFENNPFAYKCVLYWRNFGLNLRTSELDVIKFLSQYLNIDYKRLNKNLTFKELNIKDKNFEELMEKFRTEFLIDRESINLKEIICIEDLIKIKKKSR